MGLPEESPWDVDFALVPFGMSEVGVLDGDEPVDVGQVFLGPTDAYFSDPWIEGVAVLTFMEEAFSLFRKGEIQ